MDNVGYPLYVWFERSLIFALSIHPKNEKNFPKNDLIFPKTTKIPKNIQIV